MRTRLLSDGKLRVILSRRNLQALLAKLEIPDSARTLISPDGSVIVEAEPDEDHYKDRPPGPMHPMTEAILRLKEEF